MVWPWHPVKELVLSFWQRECPLSTHEFLSVDPSCSAFSAWYQAWLQGAIILLHAIYRLSSVIMIWKHIFCCSFRTTNLIFLVSLFPSLLGITMWRIFHQVYTFPLWRDASNRLTNPVRKMLLEIAKMGLCFVDQKNSIAKWSCKWSAIPFKAK